MWACLAEAIGVENFLEYDLDIVKDSIRNQKPVIIWGTGANATKRLYPWLKEMGANIIAFCDTKDRERGSIIIDEVRCYALSDIENKRKALFLISYEEEYEEIRDTLRKEEVSFFDYEYSRKICGRE